MELLRQIAEIRSPLLDALMLAVTFLSSPAVILTIISWIFYNHDANKAVCTGIAVSFAWLFVEGMKIIVRMPRPWVTDPSFMPVYPEAAAYAGYAFPGMRSALTAALAAVVIYYNKNKILRAAMVIAALAAAFSELYLGYCLPSAAGAGIIIGAIISSFTIFFWQKYLSKRRDYGIFVFLMVGLSAVLIFLALSLEINDTIDSQNAAACYEAAGTAAGFALGTYFTRRTARFTTNVKAFRKTGRFMIGLTGTLLLTYLAVISENIMNCPARILLNALKGFWIFGLTPFIFSKFENAGSGK